MPSSAPDVIFKSQFIRAGAGAGKTTKLISTFLDFVRSFKEAKGRYPRIVMTTFTRKATQEVKERLLVSALKANEKDIFEYINKKSYVHISTIHGLLSLYLSQYAERMKFPQEIKIIDGVQYDRILKKRINELLKKKTSYFELLESYSFAQLVDVAGKALNFKAQNKDFNFVQQQELQAISDQKKKALADNIDKVLLLVPSEPESWSQYFLFLKNIKSLISQDKEAELVDLISQAPTKPRWSNGKPPFDPIAHAVIEEIKDVQFKKLFNTQDYISKHQELNSLFFDFINELHDIILNYKRSTGELTIADLENLSLQLLQEHPDTASEFSDSWDYFMIDEYQDTSPLQVSILNHIIRNKPCFIVGDPQQSIYLFRGARSEVFEEKQIEMTKKNAEIDFLETNYRSEPSLMHFMNEFFNKFSGQFKPMKTKQQVTEKKALKYDAYYIKAEEQSTAVLNQIHFLMSQGINPQDICVLSRSNSKLTDLAVKANHVGIPVQLQAAAGFEEKREILDLISFNRFLNNPHDNENLVTLLRSPWFYMNDTDILQYSQSATSKSASLWVAILGSSHSQKENLLWFLDLYDKAGSLQATRQFISDTSFLTLSERYDKTGKREANIFKFLSTLAQAEKQSGFSLGLFLDEQFQSLQSDLGSLNSEAQPVVQPNCVSLMTVHASKGLQFKHVIILGVADTPQVSRVQKLSLDDSSQKFSLAVLNDETSKHEASDWSEMIIKKFNERELAEYDRVLYVAMTRAIESISLIVETNKRSFSEKSWYKRVVWPEEGEHIEENYAIEAVTYDQDIASLDSVSASGVTARSKFSTAVAVDDVSESVTELLSAKNVSSAEVDYENILGNLKKAQKGSDLHRIFESMKYLPKAAVVAHINDNDRELVNYLLEQTDLPLTEILQKGHNEWGFGLLTKQRLIQGQIDLWCELENEIHILDYKTGSSFYASKAFDQLSFYTLALLSMRQIATTKKIVHSVVYPGEKLIKQRIFSHADDFRKQLPQEITALF